MPTPDERNLNPITDFLETEAQKQERLENEEKLKVLLKELKAKLPVGR